MTKLNRRIQLNRLKIEEEREIRELMIVVQVGGKNIYQSYPQKVKNNGVNFFGESVEIQVQEGQLQLKVIQIGKDDKQTMLISFRPKFSEIMPIKKQTIISTKHNYSLNWTCQSSDLNDTDDEDLLGTNCNMSEIHHQVLSDEMMQRKIKKAYSVILGQEQQNGDWKYAQSQIASTGYQ